ncbi:deoxyguanosinetriphosphate triphosphohydrolase-like protein [compost metagenome]
MEWKGGLMIEKMFEAMLNDNLLLPPELRQKWSDNKQTDSRLVCDYIAGMTDTFALTMYSRLFDTKSGHLFDIG